jgi:hypothetical protein
MTRSSHRALPFGLLCAVASLFTWLSLEGAARADGGNCPTPPVLLGMDTGTTVGATNNVADVPLGCNGIFTGVAGPDVFYEIPVGPANNFAITVTPSAGYDTSIYLLSTCGDGTTCAMGLGADDNPEGQPETITVNGLTPGTYFLGIDSFYAASDSRGSGTYSVQITGTIGASPTTVTVTPSVSQTVFGQSVTFTAVVASAGGTPSGQVTFQVDGTPQAPVTLDGSGQATLTTSSLAPGSHTIVASYLGDPAFGPSMGSAGETVNLATTTTIVGSSGTPSQLGDMVTFTATVAAAAPGAGLPTGSVTFQIDGTPQTAITLTGGSAALTTGALPPGMHSIIATYSGDMNFLTSASAPTLQVVLSAATTTTVTSSGSPTVFGQNVVFTVTVAGTGGTPTGMVAIVIDGTPASSVALAGGQATVATSILPPGMHTVQAVYGGDGVHATSSGSVVQIVGQATTATAVLVSPSPALNLQTVTMTATVTAVAPGGGTPGGIVDFTDGATNLGTATLDANGMAQLPRALAAGAHSIVATYTGSALYLGSASLSWSETVALANTTTTLVASANPGLTGQSITLTATVAAVSPAAGLPTGTVVFSSGAVVLGTGMLTNGQAQISTSTLPLGPSSITANYGGDASNSASTSAVLVETVDPNAAVVALTASPSVAALGVDVTFTAIVTASGTAGPTGTVTFTDGTTTLGMSTLASGTATFSTASLSGGSHTITATYNGDGTYKGGSYGTVVESITPAASSTSLTATPNPASFGSSVTFQAAVTSSVAGTPSGSITFLDGTSTLGTVVLSGGSASYATSGLAVGTHIVVAHYAGDSSFASSDSGPVVEEVTISIPGDAGLPDASAEDANAGSDAQTASSEAGAEAGTGANGDAGAASDATLATDANADAALSDGSALSDSGLIADDGGGGTSSHSSGCSCELVQSDDTGRGLASLLGAAGLAAAFVRRRRARR